jgi:predicted lipid-binding transport protein (Tim44 family)
VSAPRIRRHPIKGLIGGLLLGLGAAIMLVIYRVIAFGTNTPVVVVVVGVVVGLALSLFAPPRGRKRATAASAEAAMSTPAAAPAPEVADSSNVAPPAGWQPTHVVGSSGVATYAGAEEGGAENGFLVAGLGVQVTEQQGDWARVRCADGRDVWVDARALAPWS